MVLWFDSRSCPEVVIHDSCFSGDLLYLLAEVGEQHSFYGYDCRILQQYSQSIFGISHLVLQIKSLLMHLNECFSSLESEYQSLAHIQGAKFGKMRAIFDEHSCK